MNKKLGDDLQQLGELLEQVKQQGMRYLEQVNERSTTAKAASYTFQGLNEEGLGGSGALHDFNQRLEPLMVASSGPRYWGFVTGGTTPASIMGDWLTSIYDQNTQSVKGQGDISANIELETIAMMLELFGLPKTFLGGFVTGATMSNFTCLGVARQWLGARHNKDIARDGWQGPMPVLSATPHSSSVKALAMLGMGSSQIIPVKTLEGSREALDIDELEKSIVALNGAPFILISSGGTVNTVDFDDFNAIAALKSKYKFWWHIDAAFGGFAACSPLYKHLVEGWEHADSITIDNHKWMNVPYESAIFLVREEHRMLQMQTFQNSNAPYLGDPLENFSYLNFLPENSRRLKALPAWFSLKAYGREGYRDIVERSVALAQMLGKLIEASEQFELLAPVRLNNICFTLKNATSPESVDQFLNRLNATGKVFMTPTIFKGRKGIRASFVNWRTSEEDVRLVVGEMGDYRP